MCLDGRHADEEFVRDLAPVDGDDVHRLRHALEFHCTRRRTGNARSGGRLLARQDLAPGCEGGDPRCLVHSPPAEAAVHPVCIRGMDAHADRRREAVVGPVLSEAALNGDRARQRRFRISE
jgi:hypothetical protein